MSLRTTALLLSVVALAPLAPVAADAPKVSSFYPGGARRGDTVQVQAEGSFKPWPVQVWVDRPGLMFEPGEEAGRFSATVSPDASPGVYWVRLYNAEGAAPIRPFVVGTLPEIIEAEPNDAGDQAQAIGPEATVINGKLQKSGDVDTFALPLDSGQTLVAALEANRHLGSPMDGVLQIVSPLGFVLDHADNSPTLDPGLTFTAPSAGTYLVRVFAFPAEPNSSIRFAGAEDYVYRLTLTTGGLVDLALPSAVSASGIEAAPDSLPVGWNLPVEAASLTTAPASGRRRVAWDDNLAGFAQLDIVEIPVVLEPDADDPPPIPAPALVCGRLDIPGQVDTIPLRAPAGASLSLRVEGRSLGAPIDPVLRIVDSSGAQLAEADDSRRDPDPQATVTVPADGLLTVSIRDLHGRGGPRYLYRLDAREVAPRLVASVAADHFELNPGSPLEIAVSIDRQDGFDRTVTFAAEGLPDGVRLESATSEPEGDSSKKVTLRLLAVDVSPWSGSVHLLALDPDGQPLQPVEASRLDGSLTEDLWLTVLPATDSTGEADADGS
ncbi:PPC domain-containing protein [Tautonia sociabilis]|uniref:Pre-peptidase n=1 Tax=Tautonia sociabilis TaxID=2080755 RepID=A0A432MQ12_9BACT|nr:PPC domain-containing protein [Tautonia sociabilis]RUL89329.1 pre-peptidase [Tautonia sociabilis]